MADPVIRVCGLGKSYRTAAGLFPALREVDLEIQAGEFVAIMGPSGSGKSTFMNLLGCLDTPSCGEYFLTGQRVAQLSRDQLAELRNRSIGFVFQGFNLLPRMTLADNVALPLVYAGVERDQRQRRALDELARVGLGDYGNALPSRISGGQQQRVAIARALINSPQLILADEPTGNLDRATGEEVVRLLEELNTTGVTLIVVTHDATLGARAHRQLLMEDGALRHDRYRSTTPMTAD